MSRPIDYSRWSTVTVSDDEEDPNEEEEEEELPPPPSYQPSPGVTVYRAPVSVTIGPKGAPVVGSVASPSCAASAPSTTAVSTLPSVAATPKKSDSYIRNGGSSSSGFQWSQTLETARVALPVPEGTKAKECRVRIVVSSTPSGEPERPLRSERLTVAIAGRDLLGSLHSGPWEFRYPLYHSGPDGDEAFYSRLRSWNAPITAPVEYEPDWELLSDASHGRLLVLTLPKAVGSAYSVVGGSVAAAGGASGGVVRGLWWDRVFSFQPQEEIINVLALQDRNPGRTASANSMSKAWEEAHQQFAASIAKRDETL
jgi:hypothetical protein